MAQNLSIRLTELLGADPRFVDNDGELVKAAMIDRAWRTDRELVALLLTDETVKTAFFEEISGHWIFKAGEFVEYVADKNFLADNYTKFRNRIGLTIDEKFLRERGAEPLACPYKDCVLEGDHSDKDELMQWTYLKWYVDPRNPESARESFVALGEEEDGCEKQKHLLCQLLDKNQLYVNTSDMNDIDFSIPDEDKRLTREFLSTAGG